MTDQFGEEAAPLIDMLDKMNSALQHLTSTPEAEESRDLLPDIDRQMQSAVEESGVEQQIHVFFEQDTMRPFEQVYGKLEIGETLDDLPAGHRQHRLAVLKKADQIAFGAKAQGRDISLAQALEDAHLLVTQKYRDKILTDGIRKKVVKRSKGKTLRPAQSARIPKKELGDKPKGKRSAVQLERDTGDMLRKLFKS